MLLSIVAMLFLIGIIVMIFMVSSGKLYDSIGTISKTSASAIDTELSVTEAELTNVTLTTCAAQRDGKLTSITYVYNATGAVDSTKNWTLSTDTSKPCVITNNTALPTGLNTAVNVSYSYTYTADSLAQDVINDTTASIGDTTDWFATFIVLGAMVVLILLVVIIINSIRGSGIMGGGEQPPKESA